MQFNCLSAVDLISLSVFLYPLIKLFATYKSMDQDQSILTPQLFFQAWSRPEFEIVGVIQFINIHEFYHKGFNRSYAVISDGNRSIEAVINPRLAERFVNAIRKLDILEVSLILFQIGEHYKAFILDFTRVQTKVSAVIGSPQPLIFEEFDCEFLPDNYQWEEQEQEEEVKPTDELENGLEENAELQGEPEQINGAGLNVEWQNAMEPEQPHVENQIVQIGHIEQQENATEVIREEPQEIIVIEEPVSAPTNSAQKHSWASEIKQFLDMKNGSYKLKDTQEKGEFDISKRQEEYNNIELDAQKNDQEQFEIPNEVPIIQELARSNEEGPNDYQPYFVLLENNNGVPPNQLLQKRAYTEGEEIFNKIRELNDSDREFLIKARIIFKSELTPCDPKKVHRKHFFSAVLKDQTGSIRATFFKDEASYFHELLQEGKVYSFSSGEVRKPALRFNTTNHKFEIIFHPGVEIYEVDESNDYGKDEINLTLISACIQKPEYMVCDVIGIVGEIGESTEETKEDGNTVVMRKAKIADHSDTELELLIYGDACATVKLEPFAIYIFRNVKIRVFEDRKYLHWEVNSKTIPESEIGPEFEEELVSLHNMTERYFARKQKEEEDRQKSLGIEVMNDRLVFLDDLKVLCQFYFSLYENRKKVLSPEFTGQIIVIIPERLFLCFCPHTECGSQLLLLQRQIFYCQKCNTTISQPVIVFRMETEVIGAKDTAIIMITGDESCLNIFGHTVQELMEIELVDQELYNEIIQEALSREYYFKSKIQFDPHQSSGLNYMIEANQIVPIDRSIEIMSDLVKETLTQNQDQP